MVKYVYDAWGNHAVLHTNGNEIKGGIGVLNPFRYRGYYYDTETELYYLQTRYYDPEIGRFISQDSIDYAAPETINGLNLYAYCGNNPVMYIDPIGTTKWWEWLLLGIASVVVVGAAIIATVATGGVALVAGGIAIGGALGGLASIVGQGVTNGWDNISVGGIAGGMLLGSALGGLGAIAIGGAGVGAGVLAIAGGGSVSSGVAAVVGLGLIATNVWFASDSKPGNNQAQNKQIRSAIRELGYNPSNPNIKDIINQVEKYIRKNQLNYGYKDLLELLIDFLP